MKTKKRWHAGKRAESKKPLILAEQRLLLMLVANQGEKDKFPDRPPRLTRRGSEPKNWWSTGLDHRILAPFFVHEVFAKSNKEPQRGAVDASEHISCERALHIWRRSH
ncbi:hypothetical protein [Caballeronia sp. GAFFF2]|uniref:hypothetical protein n=1 Tax=Caballeronia sp. GAFFF2 TaxID=2921741 RepID=UPI002028E5F2|nr:hypothetical protein [Caballeronia sp. GAFFF2]